MRIRALERGDRKVVLGAWLRLMQAGQAANPSFRWHPDAPRRMEGFWRDLFGVPSRVPVGFLAEGEEFAGFVLMRALPEHPILDRPPTVQISDLWVEPSARRQGVGRQLVSAVFEAFAGWEVLASTLHADERAVDFWQGVGFAPHQITLTAPPRPLRRP